MKRQSPDDFASSAPKRNRSDDPLPVTSNARVTYDPRTTPRNNPHYDPSMDRYLGPSQPNPGYDPGMDRYLGL